MMLAVVIFAGERWLVPALIALAIAGLLLAWSYRSVWRAGNAVRWAAVAKFAALALLAICLAEPLWSSQRARPGANLMVLLADDSRSLSLQDPGEPTPRGDQLKALLLDDKAPWQVRLEQDFSVRRYQFQSQPRYVADFAHLAFSGERSDLGNVLRTIRERLRERPVAGVMLFTDGISTDDVSDADLEGLPPVYPVVIGKSAGHRDLAITSVNTTTTSFEDAPVTMLVEVAAVGLPSGPVTLRIDDQQGTAVKHETQPLEADNPTLTFRIQLRPTETGVTFYRVRVAQGDGLDAFEQAPPTAEATLDNNTRLVTVDRGTGPYRLLYLSGRPNWELKFLRRALADDDQLRLTSIVRIAKKEAKFDFRGRAGESANSLFRGFDRVGEDTERYDQPVLVRLNTESPDELRDGFPKTADELYKFHAIILDDVEATFFSAEQLSLIERFVSERGGGFLMLGGQESFRQGGYESTAVGRMLPVYLNAPSILPDAGGYRLNYSREGWLQPWVRLRSTEADEAQRLRELASFRTLNTTSGLKPGASVLAQVTDSQGGPRPALVEHRYGQGRAAAILLGDLWRSQLEVAANLESRDDLGKAWRQMLRWLIVDVPDRVEVKAVADDQADVPVMRLEAHVRDPQFQPQDNAAVKFSVQPPEGPALELPGEPSLREPGLYEAVVGTHPAGAWKVSVEVQDPDGAFLGRGASGWAADPLGNELRQVAPDTELLQRIAQQTGGQVTTVDDLERLAESLPQRAAPLTETSLSPLWHHPLVLGLIIAALCLEWGTRRRRGLP